MNFYERIRTIYWKELIDILRDHRTLIAMIVVPIVLYPLLMLGSIQAVTYQSEAQKDEEVRFGVVSDAQGQNLHRLIQQDHMALKQEAAERKGGGAQVEGQSPAPLEKFSILRFESRREIERRVADRSIHVGVVFPQGDRLIDDPHVTNQIEFLIDAEDVRSVFAKNRMAEILRRTRDRTVAERKAQANLPPAFDEPFDIRVTDLSSPPSVLGQVLPLILILMTITGAIYPAIDVTAGERERGTLESLMVSPVRVYELVVGKFLVVTTVAVMGAALNLASVTATVYFGGFKKVVATDTGLPLATMLLILLCLVPFAVLMSAIMIAVCCFARTFKEAQNYVTPVILAVLIPGGIAALPTTRLDGVMMVMPVGNMVLLARDLLLGAAVPTWQIGVVLLSTTFYAGAAVALAASIFGRESVVFADAGSWRTALSRKLIKRSSVPSISMGLLLTALLFPTWFFIQAAYSPQPGGSAIELLLITAWMMPLLFLLLPMGVAWFWRVDIVNTFLLRLPRGRHLLGGVLLGLTAFVPAYWVNTAQQHWIGIPKSVLDSSQLLIETLRQLSPGAALLVLAAIPAVCEESLFRGFLLTSLRCSWSKWTAILTSAVIFGIFHFVFFKFPVTIGLGVVLAYLCVQSGSIVPSLTAHAMHNAIGVLHARYPDAFARFGIAADPDGAGFSTGVTVVGIGLFVTGIVLIRPAVTTAFAVRARTA